MSIGSFDCKHKKIRYTLRKRGDSDFMHGEIKWGIWMLGVFPGGSE